VDEVRVATSALRLCSTERESQVATAWESGDENGYKNTPVSVTLSSPDALHPQGRFPLTTTAHRHPYVARYGLACIR